MKAALLGAREVGFTVAVDQPVARRGVHPAAVHGAGMLGRLFREFAVTLSVAVLISLVISLTTTPMMCAWLLKPGGANEQRPGWLARLPSAATTGCCARYEQSLDWALASKALVMLILLAVVALNVYLFIVVPKGFFPQQDTGQLARRPARRPEHLVQGDGRQAAPGRSTSCGAIRRSQSVVGFIGGARAGGGFMFVELKPVAERTERGLAVIARLRPQLAHVTGLRIFL